MSTKNLSIFLILAVCILMVNDYYLRSMHEIIIPQSTVATEEIESYKICHNSTVYAVRNIPKEDLNAIESDFLNKGEIITAYEIGLPGMEVVEIKFPFIIDSKWSDGTPVAFCISYQELQGIRI